MIHKNDWKKLFVEPLKSLLLQLIILLYLSICVDQTILSTENTNVSDQSLALTETNQSHRQGKCKSAEMLC